MKRIFSIGFIFLVILSGIYFSFATHYCGGKIAATKFSFSGQKASCGMETGKMDCPAKGNYITSDCCNDEIYYYSVYSDYTKPEIQDTHASQPLFKNFSIPVALKLHYYHNAVATCPAIRPLCLIFISAVSLPDICSFRT